MSTWNEYLAAVGADDSCDAGAVQGLADQYGVNLHNISHVEAMELVSRWDVEDWYDVDEDLLEVVASAAERDEASLDFEDLWVRQALDSGFLYQGSDSDDAFSELFVQAGNLALNLFAERHDTNQPVVFIESLLKTITEAGRPGFDQYQVREGNTQLLEKLVNKFDEECAEFRARQKRFALALRALNDSNVFDVDNYHPKLGETLMRLEQDTGVGPIYDRQESFTSNWDESSENVYGASTPADDSQDD